MVITIPIEDKLFRIGELEMQGNKLEYSKMFECIYAKNGLSLITFSDCEEFLLFTYELRLVDIEPLYILIKLSRRTITHNTKHFIIDHNPTVIINKFAEELKSYTAYINYEVDYTKVFQVGSDII